MRKLQKWFSITIAWIFAFSLFATPAMADGEGGQESLQVPPQILYLKDNTIYRHNLADNTSSEVLTVEDGGQSVWDGALSDRKIKPVKTLAQKAFYTTGFSPGQRYMFHYQDIDYTDARSTLTLWDLARPEDPPSVLRDCWGFSIMTDYRMLYLLHDKVAGGELWKNYDLSSGQTLPGQLEAEDGSLFSMILATNETGSLALWEESRLVVGSQKLYLVQLDNLTAGKELLLSGSYNIKYISDDLQTIYYETGGALYCLKGLSKKIKAAENYDSFHVIAGTGDAYWGLTAGLVSVMDFIDDDMAEADAGISQPNAAAMEPSEYEAANRLYEEKLDRDVVRQSGDAVFGGFRMNLYYFNGEDSIKVADNVLNYEQIGDDIDTSSGKYVYFNIGSSPGMDAFSAQIISPPLHSVKMSEITSVSQALSLATDLLDADRTNVFITGGKCFPVPIDESSEIMDVYDSGFDDNEHLFYYIEGPGNSGPFETTGTLKSIPYTADGFGTPDTVDSGVDGIFSKTGGSVFYYKSQPDESEYTLVDLYTKGELAAKNVFDWQFYDGYLYYLKLDGPSYVLCRCSEGKNEQIMASAHWFSPLGKDYVAVIHDGGEEGQGDLYLWKADGTKILIAEDVEDASGMVTTYGVGECGWEETYPNSN